MEQETVEERLTRIEARTDDHGQQVKAAQKLREPAPELVGTDCELKTALVCAPLQLWVEPALLGQM
jgi:hypothetical protein